MLLIKWFKDLIMLYESNYIIPLKQMCSLKCKIVMQYLIQNDQKAVLKYYSWNKCLGVHDYVNYEIVN